MNQVVIPFQGWNLIAWANAQPSDARVAVRPICEAIGLTWTTQYRKLLDDPSRFSCAHMNTTGADGKQYQMVTLPVSQLNVWLNNINSKKVSPEIRPLLQQFQAYCEQAIYAALSGTANTQVVAELHQRINQLVEQIAQLTNLVSQQLQQINALTDVVQNQGAQIRQLESEAGKPLSMLARQAGRNLRDFRNN